MTRGQDPANDPLSPAEPATGPMSLGVLCQRAERLIGRVNALGDQVETLYARPERLRSETDEVARRLGEAREQLDARLGEIRQAEQACSASLETLNRAVPEVRDTVAGLVQRVTRARELGRAFNGLMDDADAKIHAMSRVVRDADERRERLAATVQNLARVQNAAQHWGRAVRRLGDEQRDLARSAGIAAEKLKTLIDAGGRLRETLRHDVVALRELLRQSREERFAWEQLFARTHGAGRTQAPPGRQELAPSNAPAPTAPPGPSPAALAARVRRITGFIRQVTESGGASGKPDPAERVSAAGIPG
jgi:uncharacterized protein YukE